MVDLSTQGESLAPVLELQQAVRLSRCLVPSYPLVDRSAREAVPVCGVAWIGWVGAVSSPVDTINIRQWTGGVKWLVISVAYRCGLY